MTEDHPSRRDLAVLAVAGAALTAPAGAATLPHDPVLTLAFEVTIALGPVVDQGMIEGTQHRFVPITGGSIAGPKLTGAVLPGGGDWQQIGSDGLTRIHARYFLRATDGATIAIDNPGVRVASPEIIARLTAGEDLDPRLYYFRTTPRFEAPAGPHAWLTRTIFVGQGIRHPESVVLRVFELS